MPTERAGARPLGLTWSAASERVHPRLAALATSRLRIFIASAHVNRPIETRRARARARADEQTDEQTDERTRATCSSLRSMPDVLAVRSFRRRQHCRFAVERASFHLNCLSRSSRAHTNKQTRSLIINSIALRLIRKQIFKLSICVCVCV